MEQLKKFGAGTQPDQKPLQQPAGSNQPVPGRETRKVAPQRVPQNISPIKKQVATEGASFRPSGKGGGSMHGGPKADINLPSADGPTKGGAGGGSGLSAENSLFNKHYNKELKLCEDEIPMVLCELNESALAYLNREQFENALLLLQKAHGVLDAVDLGGSRRDQYIALQLFHNMAMCYQKQGQLEECALCLETTLDHLGTDYASMRAQSFAMRIFKLKMEAKLRLQFCAILSQLHRHKEAFEQAQEGIKLAHLIIRDSISVCRYYSRRIDLLANDSNENSSFFRDKEDSISQSEATMSKSKGNRGRKTAEHRKSLDDNSSFPFKDDDEGMGFSYFQNNLDIENLSDSSKGQYQTKQAMYNNLEDSISLAERTAKKLMPIYQEVLRKIQVIEKKKRPADEDKAKGKDASQQEMESSDIDSRIGGNRNDSGARQKDAKKGKKQTGRRDEKLSVDLRHILGFLNQTEWIQNLNIGNIMQISPLRQEDVSQIRTNEECMTRDSFLEVISFLIVGYFCASTEIRFIIQLKEEICKFKDFSIEKKSQESELWHTLSLDIACSFLPSDCPLLNHILLSYQKHHAPSQTAIPENQTLDERLKVIKPLNGIDNSKFQPIIRELSGVKIELPLAKIRPAHKTVSKMLRDLQRGTSEEVAHAKLKFSVGASKSPGAQQANMRKSPSKQLKTHQVKKVLKLERIISQFSKDIGMEQKTLLRMILGDKEPEKTPPPMLSQQQSQLPSGQNSSRPKSHHEKLGHQDLDPINTGQAAKIAYNNIDKYQSQDQPSDGQILNSQQSLKSSSTQNGWKMSPQQYNRSKQSDNQKKNQSKNTFSNISDIDTKHSKNEQQLTEPKSQRVVSSNTNGEKRMYESETTHRTGKIQGQEFNNFHNDLSNISVNLSSHQMHDKSFNDQLDDKNKFVFANPGEPGQGAQHHNLSIGAMGSGGQGNAQAAANQSHGGTVRQPSKRIHSQERGAKIQRPRSSKGYRGNQANGAPPGHVSNQNMGNMNVHHQMSAHHLPSGGMANLAKHQGGQNIHSSSNTNVAQKLQMSKSEERALKSQQNQRTILNKNNQRQKTAGGVHPHHGGLNAHLASNHAFGKDQLNLSNQKNQGLGAFGAGPNIGSQSSTQLPSTAGLQMAQNSGILGTAGSQGNFQKLSKKQMQQIMSQQNPQTQAMYGGPGLREQNPNALTGPAGAAGVNYNSLNSMNQKNQAKMKVNYEELKKILIKEYSASQAQLILAQHAASLTGQNHQGINPNFFSQSNLNGIQLEGLAQPQTSGPRSGNPGSGGGKQKKMTANPGQPSQVLQNVSSFDKFDQIQVNLDGFESRGGNQASQASLPTNNRDLKELIHHQQQHQSTQDASGNTTHHSSQVMNTSQNSTQGGNHQQKKAKQILAQVRKTSAHHHAQGGGPNIMSSSLQASSSNPGSQGPAQNHQAAQQIYLHSLQTSIGQNRPSSSNNTSHQVSLKQSLSSAQTNPASALGSGGRSQTKVGGNHHLAAQHREANSKSALGTIGGLGGIQPMQQNQSVHQNQNQQASSANNNSLKRREKGRLIMQEWLSKSNGNGGPTQGGQGPDKSHKFVPQAAGGGQGGQQPSAQFKQQQMQQSSHASQERKGGNAPNPNGFQTQSGSIVPLGQSDVNNFEGRRKSQPI